MTSSLQHWQPLERNDRRVQRARMRLPAGASEHRVTFLIEESLRLMALPGEGQGRTYYFRRVALRGVPAGAPLGEWIDRTQSMMHVLARSALHGKDSRAASADAVFFHSQQEALEWLLGRVLRLSSANLESAEWFAPMISNVPSASNAASQIVAIVERLRSLPAGWFAAATVLLETVESDPAIIPLIASLPERTIHSWLSELGLAPASGGHASRLSPRRRRLLLDRLASHYGPTASRLTHALIELPSTHASSLQPRQELPPHLVWLAAMSIIAEDPGELTRGSAAAQARTLLGELAQSLDPASQKDHRDSQPSVRKIAAEKELELRAKQIEPRSKSATEDAPDTAQESQLDLPDPELDPASDGSLPTDAGGLYFLLNVLRHLGIANAIEQLPPPVRGTFLARLIFSLAQAASVSSDDPALLWSMAQLDADDSEFHIASTLCWPRDFSQPPEAYNNLARLVRVWTLAVRRWCWLMGRITLREIVCRPGQILLTRTDLDVTLSMHTVDLRLRRLGLDLDPGWLPWFGRVVRFHYTSSHARTGTGGATG